ncbi:hypothetical protein [uncultured Tateyamaria sp.]|uniref:hypothetical protein n=1 Tax=Tateyamaria sp. 1078 TaxID=3417464 RepID=UPI002604F98F|nr:hypothetical protein [uncultured Tateyamaria sp.]
MIRLLCIAALVSVTACATTTNEEPGSITLRGDTYRTVTRTFQTDDGRTYQRMTIYVGAERVSCIPGDIRDCEVALSDIFTRPRGR